MRRKAMASEDTSKGTAKPPAESVGAKRQTAARAKPARRAKLRAPAKRSRKEQAELVKKAAATLTAAGYPAGESLLKKKRKR